MATSASCLSHCLIGPGFHGHHVQTTQQCVKQVTLCLLLFTFGACGWQLSCHRRLPRPNTLKLIQTPLAVAFSVPHMCGWSRRFSIVSGASWGPALRGLSPSNSAPLQQPAVLAFAVRVLEPIPQAPAKYIHDTAHVQWLDSRLECMSKCCLQQCSAGLLDSKQCRATWLERQAPSSHNAPHKQRSKASAVASSDK